MSSYNNLNSVSKTLTTHIWNGIKDDPQIKTIIQNPRQISHLLPKEAQTESNQISVFLYNVTELPSVRNQPQTTQNPPTLLYLNLHYLITPLTQNAENDQIVLGKIMQLFRKRLFFEDPTYKEAYAKAATNSKSFWMRLQQMI